MSVFRTPATFLAFNVRFFGLGSGAEEGDVRDQRVDFRHGRMHNRHVLGV